MKPNREFIFYLVACFGMFMFPLSFADQNGVNQLFTDELAGKLSLSNEEFGEELALSKDTGTAGGPIIKVVTPDVGSDSNWIRFVTPSDFKIIFLETRAEINMDSLSVCGYKLGKCWDITEHFQDYVVGQSIEAADLSIKKGKYKIKFMIADVSGNQAERMLKLESKNR